MDLDACEKIGEVSEKSGEMQYDWSIPRFFSLPAEVGNFYCSSEFLFHDACWSLVIYPNGRAGQEIEDRICLHVTRLDWGPPRTVNYRLGLRKANGEEMVLNEDKLTFFKLGDPCWGTPSFFDRADLLERKLDLAPLDTLTITCTLKSEDSYSAEVSLFRRLWDLSKDFQAILTEGRECDLKMKLKDSEVPAHRVVLEKRSEVFQNMLKADIQEVQTGRASLKRWDDEAARVVLNFMYSGEPRGISPENVCEVYRISHLYEIEQLRKFCVAFIQGSMSVDLVCDVMVVARLYEDQNLKEAAKDFFTKNESEIVKSEKWKAYKRRRSATCFGMSLIQYGAEFL